MTARRRFLLTTINAAALWSAAAWSPSAWAEPQVTAAASTPLAPDTLALFGVALKGATRAQLREAFVQGGLLPTRVDDAYWVDTYNPEHALEGASALTAGYVFKSGRFAYAQYAFESFMDSAMVTRVAALVTQKYGRAHTHQGDDGLGEVTYQWNFPQGMTLRVSRGWPDTSTYLTFTDKSAYAQMQAEQASDALAQSRAKAKAQSRAF